MTTHLRDPLRVAATLAVLLVSALGSVALGVQPAAAHASLVSSDPADGATLDQPPSEVTLTFSEELREPAFVTVRHAGRSVTSGDRAEVDGAGVAVPVLGEDAGDYTIAYRVVSADGHPIEGEVSYTAANAAPEPSPAPEPTDAPTSPGPSPATDDASEAASETGAEPASAAASDDGSSTWVVVGIGVGVAVAVAVLLGVARRRGAS